MRLAAAVTLEAGPGDVDVACGVVVAAAGVVAELAVAVGDGVAPF